MEAIMVQGFGGVHVEGASLHAHANATDNASHQLVAAPGTGLYIYVCGYDITNAHATVSTKVTIGDGTIDKVVYAAAVGGGAGRVVWPPLRLTANTQLRVICGTTGADVDANVDYFIGP